MKKNLVIIMMDQQRQDYLGCYGNQYVNTPNIDKLAADSVRFDDCYVNNPICMPNRMSVFTGMYPRNHGMWTNGLMLPHRLPTLASHLHDNGYATASIGKIHFEPTDCGGDSPIVSMEDHRYWSQRGDDIDWSGPYWGFDHVELTVGHATRPIAHYGKWFRQHGGADDMAKARKIDGFDCCPVTSMPAELHDSAFIGERSADFIKSQANSDRPFFLFASFPDPHHPFNPPAAVAGQYKDAPVRMPINENDPLDSRPTHYRQHQQGIWHRAGILKETEGMTPAEREQVRKNLAVISEFMDEEILRGLGLLTGGASEAKKDEGISPRERDQRIRNTYAMVDLIDRGVGHIIEALEQSGQLENTVIILTADHGELMGDHGVWLKGPFFYDGLIKVPLLVRAPGVAASSTHALASSIDIFPTCCELLDIDVPLYCDGLSLAPALDGESPRKACVIEYRNGYFESDVNTMGYIDDAYKFIQYQNGECELTDRKNDPEENINLVHNGNNPDLLCKYREKLLLAMLATGVKTPAQISHA